MSRVVVLGAGFGGLEVSARLSAEFGEAADVVLIDRSDAFVFGFSKLDVMFGKARPETVRHHYRDLVKPGVRFVQAEIERIDPVAKTVETDAGRFEADALVVALGADLHPDETPGLVEAGQEFYTEAGAAAAREAIARFEGGRVIVGVTSTPYKCAPAPSETVLLLHDELVARGIRDRSEIALVVPMPRPVPPAPSASAALLTRFAELDIRWYPERIIRGLDPERHVALLSDGEELGFDLFLGVPRHRVPAVIAESGLSVDGWIPVDPATLETAFPGVYAIGDVTSSGTPKAGSFAEGQGVVVAERIASLLRGEPPAASYSGVGVCFVEFGGGTVGQVEVAFTPGEAPTGGLIGPNAAIAADKVAFAATRVSRWFGTAG